MAACQGEAPAEPVCTCTALCTEDNVNPDCPVCGTEGADLSACKGEAPAISLLSVGAWTYNEADRCIEYGEGDTLIQLKISKNDTAKTIAITGYTTIPSGCNLSLPYSVTIGGTSYTLASIGADAFNGCENLSSVNLSGCTGLEYIGINAFNGCTNLTSVNLSGCTGLASIGANAFNGCTNLTSVNLSGCTGLTTIGDSAFQFTWVAQLDLSGCTGLTTIGAYAFEGCTNLTSVDLSGRTNLASIGASAFSDCALSSVDLSGCTSLTSIGAQAFFSSRQLASVKLPESLTTIGFEVFRDCGALEKVTILAQTPPSLGTKVFEDCAGGLTIYVPKGAADTYKGDLGWNEYASKIYTAPSIALTPASESWSGAYGGSFESKTFTITNEGDAVLTITSVELGGDNTGSFTLDKNGAEGSLGGGNQTTFTVTPNAGLAAGTHTATVTVTAGEDTEPKEATLNCTVNPKFLAGAKVEVTGSYTYNGQPQTPNGNAVTVTLGGQTLTEGTDYTLSYENNRNAGTATVTVTASKVYDGTNVVENDELIFSPTGVESGDTITFSAEGSTLDGVNVGTHQLSLGTVITGGSGNGNYTVTCTGTTGTVTRRPVTVTPNAASKAYGQNDPALTYTVSGLVSGDSLTGELARAEGETVGEYAITQGTLTNDVNPNYTITFNGNGDQKLTIEKANVALRVTASPYSQKAGRSVTITVIAQNNETNRMDSGWDQPDGTVTVTVEGNSVSLTKNGGNTWTGTYTIPDDAQPGNRTVAANIAETGNYNKALDTSTPLTVTDKGVVAVLVAPDNRNPTYGESVTFTAAVMKFDSTDTDQLTGTVQFYLDGNAVGGAQDVTGQEVKITLDRSWLTAGSHTVYAVYSGNNFFGHSAAQDFVTVAKRQLGWDASDLTASRPQNETGEAAVYGTLQITGVLDGDTVNLTPTTGLVTNGLANETQPGEYTVEVVPASGDKFTIDNDNYTLPAQNPTITATIHPAQEVELPAGDDGTKYKLDVEEGISTGYSVSSGGLVSSYRDGEHDFWLTVQRKIETADPGDTIKVNAKGYDQMPWSVMEALKESDSVTLHITWNGGEDIIIPSAAALSRDTGRIYYPLSYLEGLDFTVREAGSTSVKVNPETGGIVEIIAPAAADAILTPAGQLDVTAPELGLAETPELADEGIEKAVPAISEPAAAADAPETSGGALPVGWIAAAVAVLLLAAGAGGFWFWKQRTQE